VVSPHTVAVANETADYQIGLSDCMTFLRSLPDKSVDIVTTDPAYSGMNRHLKLGHGRIVGNYSRPGNKKWFREFEDDPDAFVLFLRECHRVLKDDSHIYIMFDPYSLLTLGATVREVFQVKGVIVWDKVLMGLGHYYRRQHELVLFAAKGRRQLSRRDFTDVWSIRRLVRRHYPTQKPVALFARMLEASHVHGGVVCDPFAGSGASAIAALRSGCRFVGCDVAKDAVDLTRQRCAEYLATGVDPLESGSSIVPVKKP
jgi:site-specific DNA-methyltransferase (adenine-specific)